MGPRFQRGHCLWLELRHLIIWTHSSNQWSLTHTHTLSKQIQVKPPNIDRGIIPHQTDAQRCYFLGIITGGSLDATNCISKDTSAKQSGNCYRWWNVFTHSGITDKCLRGTPQEHKRIILSSFTASVWRNQIGTTKKQTLLHGTVKSAILDVSTSFRTHLQSDPTLESSGKISLIL